MHADADDAGVAPGKARPATGRRDGEVTGPLRHAPVGGGDLSGSAACWWIDRPAAAASPALGGGAAPLGASRMPYYVRLAEGEVQGAAAAGGAGAGSVPPSQRSADGLTAPLPTPRVPPEPPRPLRARAREGCARLEQNLLARSPAPVPSRRAQARARCRGLRRATEGAGQHRRFRAYPRCRACQWRRSLAPRSSKQRRTRRRRQLQLQYRPPLLLPLLRGRWGRSTGWQRRTRRRSSCRTTGK